MLKKILLILKHPLFSGSVIMIFGSFFTSFVNYAYHLILGRMLGPDNYGDLASVISLIGLLSIVPTAFGLVITRVISQAGEKDVNSVANFFSKKTLFSGIIIFFLITLASPLIARFLNIGNVWLIIIGAGSFIFSISSIFGRAVLQGLLKFSNLVLSQLSENIFKLVVAVVLVYVGFSTSGALFGAAVGPLLGWLIAYVFIKYLFNEKKYKPIDIKPVVIYTIPVLALSVSVTSIYSADLILVKHFFDSYSAGLYSALSFLGRIIFFAASPITGVMYPLVSRRFAKSEDYKKIFILSFLGSCLISICLIGLFKFEPELVIKLLYGAQYLSVSKLLSLFGIVVFLNTISFMLSNYFLAIGRPKIVILTVLAAIFQIVAICFFHQSLYAVIMVSLIDCAILFLSLSVFLIYDQIK